MTICQGDHGVIGMLEFLDWFTSEWGLNPLMYEWKIQHISDAMLKVIPTDAFGTSTTSSCHVQSSVHSPDLSTASSPTPLLEPSHSDTHFEDLDESLEDHHIDDDDDVGSTQV